MMPAKKHIRVKVSLTKGQADTVLRWLYQFTDMRETLHTMDNEHDKEHIRDAIMQFEKIVFEGLE